MKKNKLYKLKKKTWNSNNLSSRRETEKASLLPVFLQATGGPDFVETDFKPSRHSPFRAWFPLGDREDI
jgi:hypothetical protein